MIQILTEMAPLSAPEMTEEQAASYSLYLKLNDGLRAKLMEVVDWVNSKMKTNFILYTSNGHSIFVDFPEMEKALPSSGQDTPLKFACFFFVERHGGLPACFQHPVIHPPENEGVYYLGDNSEIGVMHLHLDDTKDLQVRAYAMIRAMSYGVGIDWELPREFGDALGKGEDVERLRLA